MRGCRGVLALLAVIVGMAVSCSAAWADGDPASDVLLSQVAFLPTDAGLSSAEQAQLTGLLHAAARAGAPVRVAIIADEYDLGSITELWKRPETYARFLGAELSLVYKHPLVVVMPNGLGVNWPGHSVAAAQRELAHVAVKPGGAGRLSAAVVAVQRLLSAQHVHVSAAAEAPPSGTSSPKRSSPAASGRSGGSSLAVIIAAALALALALVVARVAYRVPRLRRWAPVGAVVVLVAIGGPILAISLLRGSPAGASAGLVSSGTPYTLPEGRQPAPDFTLRDQNGRRLSMASFRGRDVLITFVDPLCRNLCPLEAHVLNALVDRLPTAQRPAIIAVSVDTWADSRHDLLQDFSRWSLVPQWHWAIGSHAQLASVWKRYAIGVQVVTKTLAGTTVHYITHTEASYLIDPAGYERALFAWPFSPQDVLTTLRKLSRS